MKRFWGLVLGLLLIPTLCFADIVASKGDVEIHEYGVAVKSDKKGITETPLYKVVVGDITPSLLWEAIYGPFFGPLAMNGTVYVNTPQGWKFATYTTPIWGLDKDTPEWDAALDKWADSPDAFITEGLIKVEFMPNEAQPLLASDFISLVDFFLKYHIGGFVIYLTTDAGLDKAKLIMNFLAGEKT